MDQQATSPNDQGITVEQFQQEIEKELEECQRSLKEVSLMLEQSQTELAKLTQRNAAIAGHLQQIQSNFDTCPREDIRMAYNAALDAQQRLLVMRGQLDKLQSDQTHFQRHVDNLKKVRQFLLENQVGPKVGRGGRSPSSVLEMVINAQESERQRLSRQMHDGTAQTLSNFIVQAEIASRYFEVDPARAKDELNNLRTAAMTTFQKVREYIFELRPMMLDDLGLLPTIRKYVDSFKEQTGLEVHIIISGQERRLETYLEVMVFRGLQELLWNAYNHNSDLLQKVSIKIQVNLENNMLKVAVSDTGKGFDPTSLADNKGLGLKLIRERVEMLGGTFEVDSALGQGCRIVFQVPTLD